jgi:hypothetical protein
LFTRKRYGFNMLACASSTFSTVAADDFRNKLQIEKKRIVATTSTAVSRTLEVFGNLIRKKRRSPNSAISSRLNHASSAEFIRLDDAKRRLKKSRKNNEEFMKNRLSRLRWSAKWLVHQGFGSLKSSQLGCTCLARRAPPIAEYKREP